MLSKPLLEQKITLSIERLGINGEGIGAFEGFTVFLDGGLPGEKVIATVCEVRKNFARAKITGTLTLSPHRQKPPCPVFGRCGGCQIMHLDYKEQLVIKRQRVIDSLERIGKISDVEVDSCMPSPLPLAYRNKIQLPAGSEYTHLYLGLYAYNTHDLIKIDKCYIHCLLGEEAFQRVKHILKNSPLTAYDAKTGEGDLKCVLIKTAVHTKQVLVILVTTKKSLPALSLIAAQIMQSMPEIKGVLQNVNPSTSNVMLGKAFYSLIGDSYITETLSGLTFKVSPSSFFQVNPPQAERVYETVLDYASLTGKETVLDAYCGVGTLSLILAKQASKVIGVECVKDAIIDAKENAIVNHISNVQFICAPAEDFISSLKHIDVSILNPPRKGCERSFLESLSLLKPTKIIYVSCDPATLSRDLAILCKKGYKLTHVKPFDMFPQTIHVECIALLNFKND
jgi:23S rRNA (uracil1939-C5)-methyltransferase